MSSNTSSDNIFQAIQTVLAVAPVPGIAVAGIMLQEIYKLVRNIHLREQECQALVLYSATVAKVLFDHWQPGCDSQLEPAIEDINATIARMKLDMLKWKAYGKGMGYLKNNEIMDGVRRHRADLDRSLNMANLANALQQQAWNERFVAAQRQDSETLQSISERQDQLIETVQQLQRLLVSSIPAQPQPPAYGAAPAPYQPIVGPDPRSYAIDKLYRLRSERHDTAILPFRELLNEVTKTGQRPVHAGSMYDIWKGLWLDQYVVALRVFRGSNPSDRDATRLNRQVDLWRTLRHPNILQLYGICQLEAGPNPPAYFVSPWMKNRDVMAYLGDNPHADRLKLIQDITTGLQYLHSVNILHGGLQGSNVLIDAEGNAVLSDFSLSKIMNPDLMFTHSNGPQSSLRWMAPEAHNQQLMSSRTDVYSLGMTGLQIISGLVPYYKIRAVGKVVIAIAIKNAKPERADYIDASPLLRDDRIWNLLASCWATNPDHRPYVDEVLAEVAAIRGVPIEA